MANKEKNKPKKILIIYPSSFPDNKEGDPEFKVYKGVPIGIVSIGTFLKSKGYNVKIIDARIYTKKRVMLLVDQHIKDAFCVCFSITTPQVAHGLKISDFIKSKNKHLPIIWGGIHPILFPKQTIEDKSIDYVIYGEGEYPLIELIQSIKIPEKKKLLRIKGLVFKDKNKVIINEAPLPIDPNKLPLPDYDILDIDEYLDRTLKNDLGPIKKVKAIDILTSRGCPYRCSYCINTTLTFKKWRPTDIKKIKKLIDKVIVKYKINHILFADDFLFGHKERVREIIEHIIEKKYDVTWEAAIRANLFNEKQINEDFLKLMKKSGCFALGMGMESGSNRVLKLIKKDITVEQIIHAVKQCKKYGIIPVGNFMCGFPFETKKDVLQTAKLILKLKSIYPEGLFFSPGLLRPYPGADLYDECVSKGFKTPKTLREWADKKIDVGQYVAPKDLPWIKDPKWLLNFQVYFYILLIMKGRKLAGKKISFLWDIFAKIAEFRFNNNFWAFPIEPPLLIKTRKILEKENIFTQTIRKLLKI